MEKYIEKYINKNGKDERLVRRILEQGNEDTKKCLISIIEEYDDLSNIPFSQLVNMAYLSEDKSLDDINMSIREVLELKKIKYQIFQDSEGSKTLKIKCKMFQGSEDSETSLLVCGLYDAAVKWYGEEYKERLETTIKNTLFYECKDGESVIDVEERLSGYKYPLDKKLRLSGVLGMTIKLNMEDGNYQPIIVYKKSSIFDYRATLAHELFYHQFSRQSDFIVEKDGAQFYRDGISLLPKENAPQKNVALNEGFAEYNTIGIMKIYTGNEDYALDPRRLYEPLEQYASQIASCCDRKKLISMITTGKPSIEEIYGGDPLVFKVFTTALDLYLRTEERQYLEMADFHFNVYRQSHNLNNTPSNEFDKKY